MVFEIVNGKLVIDDEEIDEAELKTYLKVQGITTKPHTLESTK